MIQVSHVTIQTKSTLLLDDLSFTLGDQGFVSFCADSQAASEMARLLMALDYPRHGDISFYGVPLTKQSQNQSSLRSQVVQGLTSDFQMQMHRTVLYNMTLDLPYPQHQVESLLKECKLFHKKDAILEDLDFIDQARTIIARCLLRQPHVLVYDAATSSFSVKEREQLFQLLKKCSEQLLVIVCGDTEASLYADHIIEIRKGKLISDTLCTSASSQLLPLQAYSLPKAKKRMIEKDINHKSRWKFRILFLCLLIGVLAINVVIFNSRLDLVELEESVLTKAGQNVIEIEKQAIGDDGTIYKNRYEHCDENDIKELEQLFGDHLVYSYQVENTNWEMRNLYGAVPKSEEMSDYDVVELDTIRDIGFTELIGNFPESYFQVCISEITASHFIQEGFFLAQGVMSNAKPEELIGKTILWYGRELQISGILPFAQNPNLSIEIKELQDNITQTKQLYENHIYVKKGFITNHDVAYSSIFPDLNTTVIVNGRQSVLGEIRDTTWVNSYFNGVVFIEGDDLQENECYLDFSAVYYLLYHERYQEIISNDDMSQQEKEADYYQYAGTLIDQTLDLKSYRIQGAADNSMVLQKSLRIKGILPITADVLKEGYLDHMDEGILYMSEQALASYMKPNYQVTGVFYQNKDPQQMRETLDALNHHPYYNAFVSNSRMFQVFVVDIKELKGALLVIGCMFMLFYILGFLYLLDRSRRANVKEMSSLYLFGVRRHTLELLYVRNAMYNLLKYMLMASVASIAVIYLLVYFIYYDFDSNASIPMGSYVMIPVIFFFIVYLLVSLVVYLFLRVRCIVDAYFKSHRNMLK